MRSLAILFADDNDLIRKLIGPQLEAAGHTVACVDDGAAAIEELRRRTFDVVVTDIVMPNKDGFEVIQAARKVRPETKVIAISGGSRGSSRDSLPMAIAFGAHAVLAKPFSYSELVAALTAAIG
jgi:CheY-like chemotaxis protein